MILHSRRSFLRGSATTLAALAVAESTPLFASPFGLPLGLQLYSVRQQLEKDFQGTLTLVSSLGYKEVEGAGFFDHSAKDVKKAMADAGLSCPSAHYNFQQMTTTTDEIIKYGGELGLQYIVCSTPGFKDPERIKNIPPRERQKAYTLEDWRWNAEQFNQIGTKVKAAGMKFGYHNHTNEEIPTAGGRVPLDILIEETDPDKVTFEMDAGWVMMGGRDPIEYLKKYPKRISMMHVKDFKDNKPSPDGRPAEATELGKGVMDYRPIFKAANKAYIKHLFVEQEGYDMQVSDSLKMDAEYVKSL
jgi:sugar phosphate isomerase/epimerase